MSPRKASHAAALEALCAAAARKPGAWVDRPWGNDVYKVGKKIFVFLDDEGGGLSITCKLPHSGEAALTLFPFAEPTGYGLGASGWVSASFAKGEEAPLPILLEWIDESYEAIAPKRAAKGKATPAKAAGRRKRSG